ncbi:MAG: hypothetical protein IJG87_06515 [Ruminococcus sp.]|nr:hypothetical protein [Ruminococcus sp.]
MPIPESPLTRGEMFLAAAATGDTSNMPEPKTREEMYLDAIAQKGGGTNVVANPTLAGTEADLVGLQVGDTKYKIPSGGGGGGGEYVAESANDYPVYDS